MKNKINKALGIVLYTLAGTLLAYTAWALTHCAKYIGDLISSEQLIFAGNEYDIVNFYMGSCAQYFLFAVLTAVAGYMLYTKAPTAMPVQQAEVSEHEDDDLDELFAAADAPDD